MRYTPREYLEQTEARMIEALEWRDRWEKRTSDQEAALRQEWDQMRRRAEVFMATSVVGEEDE